MKKQLTFVIILAAALFLFGCGKKERPSEKLSGVYKATDNWSSNKTVIGSGTLQYDLIITPDGEDGLILMNVNRTLNGIKATVINDNEFTIPTQNATSAAGKQYTVNGFRGKLTGNSLDLKFTYGDDLYASAIGTVDCAITGTREKSSSEK